MIELKHCTVEQVDGWRVVVRFRDGTTCDALPDLGPHYHVIAHRCGYGDDVARYCFEHEFMHCFAEQFFHDRPSRVLWAIAHGSMLTGRAAAYEELVAQTCQRWVRANERPIIGGVDWDRFKREALGHLDAL